MNMKVKKNVGIAIGSDRSGFVYKKKLICYLKAQGYHVEDAGTFQEEVCDYPVFAQKVGELVSSQLSDFGILICGSGEGMAIAANKVPNVRCGIAYSDEVAALLRQHNDANIVAFGANFMSYEDVKRRVDIFLSTKFLGLYHVDRIAMINKMEKRSR
ncbi:Ribose 5-phosphate isomerase B [Anaerovibrio sp. JC8]|uniref:RpiB/LacA/LacB family sugar-phosphate isomerase n=1 Tax=Anaerovibrio sp. JC8 TaxID=1240085 RepID=UPI000A0C4AD8|nr:RpiB/LacA/LacB family sugar-phosphate isomerase [Anaerovibrio sp. JC8]ORU01445.1 Ribose 5-phosphate isomerase B [Anaerovibrio sp. JC8]